MRKLILSLVVVAVAGTSVVLATRADTPPHAWDRFAFLQGTAPSDRSFERSAEADGPGIAVFRLGKPFKDVEAAVRAELKRNHGWLVVQNVPGRVELENRTPQKARWTVTVADLAEWRSERNLPPEAGARTVVTVNVGSRERSGAERFRWVWMPWTRSE